ncbi:MAG TPA: PQQ-binding-like beta-propeller repeat protein [Mycobacteriales bacterium]|jgi:polyvinyl alcohol dehydrogenase (cytochrome)|nr:PQQ-binding-like beta-propeller repeat protein [Mycobacteriales bacterium]
MNRSRLVTAALLSATALTVPPPVSAVGPLPSPVPGCGPVNVPGGEWRTFGHDAANTRHQERERQIAHADVPLLAPAWTFSSVVAGGDGDFTGTPIVADGCLYVGSNRGWVFALNADTGALVWKAKVPEGGGINSSVAVDGGRVIVAVSRTSRVAGCTGTCVGPYVAAFDQATGAVDWWTQPIDTQPGSDSYSSPVVVQGAVVVGVSGGSAELGDEADRYAFQGSLNFVDATDGTILKKTWTVHAPSATPADDYAGGGVWSTPAVDTATGYAYVGAGNPFRPQAEHPHTNAVLKLDVDRTRATWGEIVGSYKGDIDEYVPSTQDLPCVDFTGNNPPYYPQGLGSCGDLDLDFGASPNLFTDAAGRRLVGAGQKSGVYHVFDAATMDRVWTSLVGPPALVGGIVGSTAFDGTNVYGPVTPAGYLWSLGNGGSLRWASPVADAAHWGEPVSVANGIVYTVDLKGFLDAYDSRNGVPLLHRPILAGSTTGADPALSWGGVAIARNTVYAATGITGLANGFVVAFRPGGNGSTVPPVPPAPPLPEGSPGPAVVAGPGAFYSTYATPIMVAPAGGPLSFVNNDLPQHDVVAVDHGPDGLPLFRSALVGLGEVTPVEGMDRVEHGHSYAFFCSIHPGMRGTLVVP